MPRLAPKLPGLARWLPWHRRNSGGENGHGPQEDPLLEAGRRLRQEREQRGLSLRQLALETRISTPVLEALERGWRDRLPEAAYLRTMLPLIEQRLDLQAGSLEVALPARSSGRAGVEQGRASLLQRFTPGSIEVFSTWQGTLLYGGLTLGLIYVINLQQQQLAAANLLTLRPIAPLTERDQASPIDAGAALLRLYPDLRPLQRAGNGMALTALQTPASRIDPTEPGVLQLNLSQPSTVALRNDSGQRTNLQGAQGQLVLTLQTPLQLSITPSPATGEVLWNGTPLSPLNGQPGRYRLPQSPAQPPPQQQSQPQAQRP